MRVKKTFTLFDVLVAIVIIGISSAVFVGLVFY